MPSRTEVPLKDLAYSNGERQSLLPGGSSKSLCKLYASGQLEDFRSTLRTASGGDQDFLDVLDRALRNKDPANEDFVEALVQKVDELGDVSDPKRDNRTPLWTASDAGNLHAIRLLAPVGGDRERLARRLEAKNQYASTALHIAVVVACEVDSDANTECVAWLLDRHRDCEVDANAQDQLGRPALFVAAKKGSLALVSEFLKHQRIGLDLVDEITCVTARAQILERFPALGAELNARPADVAMSLGDELQRLLEHADDADSLKTFCEKVAQSDDDARALRHNCGDMTLMQQACHEGHRDAVDALMAKMPALALKPVDPVNRTPPLLLAVAQGHAGVLEVFRQRASKQFHERTVDGDTVLINLVRHWDEDDDEPYYACLELLLSEAYKDLVDVNATNSESGESALYLSALFRLSRVSIALLGAGAWLGGANKHGYTPLDFMGRDTVEKHLDECVQSEGHQGDDERQIIFHYSCLRATAVPVPASRKSVTPHDVEAQRRAGEAPRREMEALLQVSRSKELRPLLKHPVLNSFLDHKWQQMHMIYYVNAVMYTLFVIFITWHILEAGGEAGPETNELTPGVYVCVVIGFVCLAVRELAQVLMDPCRYVCEIENAMEVTLLVCSGFVIAHRQVASHSWWREFAAATVLLAWGEFVLLLGRHPKFSTYVEMLKTVTWNFLKFLVWFAGLIVAFVLCFYTLFRNEPSEGESKNVFESLPLTAFKTIVMMTGELEAGDVPFEGLPYFSRPIFIVFVFIVVMVLLNLLNGLAVSDTQAIKDDAELVCCVSRVQMAERVESKLFDLLRATRCYCSCLTPLAEQLIRSTTVLPPSDPAPKGRLMPNSDCVLTVDNPKPPATTKPGQSGLPPPDAVQPSMFCCLLGRLGVKKSFSKCIALNSKVIKRADAVLIARGATSELRDLEKRLLGRINEVTRDMEARLSHRVEEVGREVANAIREALDQRTTQL